MLHVVGRFAFQPVGVNDYSGVDTIYVEVRDDDAVDHSVIWSGYTNHDGWFDSGVVDISDDDSEPDLYVYFATVSPIVTVEHGNDYWSSDDNIVEEFEGDYYDFGTLTPAQTGVGSNDPALNAHQIITRAWQFAFDATGYRVPLVVVLRPDGDEFGYDYDGEIILGENYYLSPNVLHQYAHHIENSVGMAVEASGVCDEYCHFCEPYAACGPGDPLEKCRWCPFISPATARSEGFADWFPVAASRYFAAHYSTDSATPFDVLIPRSVEFFPPETIPNDPFNDVTDLSEVRAYCGTDPLLNADHTTIAATAFLEDAADARIDDHAGNGTHDCAALGDDAVLKTYVLDKPPDILAFISALLQRYPISTPRAVCDGQKRLSRVHDSFPAGYRPPWADSRRRLREPDPRRPCPEQLLALHSCPLADAVRRCDRRVRVQRGMEPDARRGARQVGRADRHLSTGQGAAAAPRHLVRVRPRLGLCRTLERRHQLPRSIRDQGLQR